MAFPVEDEDLYKSIRRLINEPSPLTFTNAQLLYFIHDGLSAITNRSFAWQDSQQIIQLLTNTREYAYSPIDGLFVDAAIYLGSDSVITCGPTTKALLKISPRMFKHIDDGTAGPPTSFADFENKIHFWPTPSSSENLFDVRLFMRKTMIVFAGNDTLLIPDYLQEYVIFYAVSRCFETMGKFAQAAQYMSYFDNFMNFHKADKYIAPVDSRDMMVFSDNTRYEG